MSPGGETLSSRSTRSEELKSRASDTVSTVVKTGTGATGAGGSEYAFERTT
jgi:hypothetical protein